MAHTQAPRYKTSVLLLLKNLLFTILIPGSVAVYVPLWITSAEPHTGVEGFGMAQVLSLPLFAMGACIYLWCLWDFATFGRATPAPIDAPKKLVVRGLYRFVRNPMYVGVLLTILGFVVYFTSLRLLGYAAGIALMFQTFIVLYEEPTLQRLFGDDYARYARTTGRWLPRMRRDRHRD